VVDRARVADSDEIRLGETNPKSICKPVLVEYRGSFWALRVESDDHLKLLAGSTDKLTSFRRLPDWLVFCEPLNRKGRRPHDLWAIVCELKSGGTRVPDAKRQVQLGKFLVEYLVHLATFALGNVKAMPSIDVWGLLVYPGAPMQRWAVSAKGPPDESVEHDGASDMLLYRASDKDAIRVEDLFA